MRRRILSLLLLSSLSVFAKGSETLKEELLITPLQISQNFNAESTLEMLVLSAVIDKEEKVSSCVQEYIGKQSKSYTKIAQGNLYDLIHNFDSVLLRIYGKKVLPDSTPYDEKLKSLAQAQCDAYYSIGVLE